MPVRIGFIGVGKMGRRMVSNLLRKGEKVVAYDADPEALAAIRDSGADVVSSPAALAMIPGLDVVITMLPSPKHVEDALLGPKGLLSVSQETLHPHLIVDSSTVDPSFARQMGREVEDFILHPDAQECCERRHPYMVTAPVSGGVRGAENATLTFMCGGSREAFTEVQSLLLKMGRHVVHCGEDHGSGAAAKLANNLVMAISMAAIAEGLAFGQRQGLNPKLLTDIFSTSSAQCWSLSHYNCVPGVQQGVPSSRGYEGGFSLELVEKDLDLAIKSASECQSRLDMSECARSIYHEAMKKSKPSLDFSSIYESLYHGKPAV